MLIELVYPSNISCIICNKSISKENIYSLCKDCFKELNFINDGCIKCGKTIINHAVEEIKVEQLLEGCHACLNKNYYFDKAIGCIEYDDLSKKIIFGFKYNNKTFMARYIANIIKDKLENESIEYDYILYVPLHRKRERKRGFNQSKIIANKLAKITDKKVIDCIYRNKNTLRLFKLANDERAKELKNAFKLSDDICICKNKKVLLIDDIFTTGSTANEISKLLKIRNIDTIYVCTFLTRINCY
ncbi:MAG: ComF family protein [Peptostreptococcaceae bacterium]